MWSTLCIMNVIPGDRRTAILAAVTSFLLGCLFLLAGQKLAALFLSCHERFDLLNPKVLCHQSTRQGEWDYEPLRDVLAAKKEQWKRAGTLAHLSIYFRNLDYGQRFVIGEYDKFHPASLLKVPVMVATLHEGDRDPQFLDRTLSSTGAFPPRMMSVDEAEESILPNTEYTIRELLQKMIVYSDNYSAKLLIEKLNTIPSPVAYHTFLDLDVLAMMNDPDADYISMQSYANLFSMLYNAGYLSHRLSQLALELLSQTTYRDGLVAGVPANVRVAHKFGFRKVQNGEVQLHDCGIVYHPSASYVLCVMTSGFDVQQEGAVIADISRTVYDTISALDL